MERLPAIMMGQFVVKANPYKNFMPWLYEWSYDSWGYYSEKVRKDLTWWT